ncbi:hypothetical protein NKH77_28850 [Streptomyces sp. M19]
MPLPKIDIAGYGADGRGPGTPRPGSRRPGRPATSARGPRGSCSSVGSTTRCGPFSRTCRRAGRG